MESTPCICFNYSRLLGAGFQVMAWSDLTAVTETDSAASLPVSPGFWDDFGARLTLWAAKWSHRTDKNLRTDGSLWLGGG